MKKLLTLILASFLSAGAVEALAVSNQKIINMKKYIITLGLIILVIVSSAQNFNVWEHDGNDGNLHQCYNIIEMDDGNFLVDDNVFDANGNDTGIVLHKITAAIRLPLQA